MPNEEKFDLEHVEEALRESAGILTAAALKLEKAYGSCSPRTLRNYLKRHEELREIVADVVENNLDHAESTLLKAILEGNITATIFYLKTKGRDRGYIERLGYVDKDNAPADPAVCPYVVVLPDNGRDLLIEHSSERDKIKPSAGSANGFCTDES